MTVNFSSFSMIVLYLITSISLYGLGLFAWWWWRIGKATEVYAYVTFMFLGIFLSTTTILYARVMHRDPVEGHTMYMEFINSVWWGVGPGLLLILLFFITGRMTRRIAILKWGTEDQILKELKLESCPHCGKLVSQTSGGSVRGRNGAA